VADRRSCVFPRADAQRMACRQPACHLSTRRSRTFRHPEGGLEKHAFCASYTKRARSVAAPAGARMGTCGAEGAPSMIGAGPAGGWCTSFQSAALGGNNAHRARGPRRHAPPPAARGPSPRPPAGGWGCARGGGRRRPLASASRHVIGTPTRSLHARGAGAPGDTSGCPGWVASRDSHRPPSVAATAGRRMGCARGGGRAHP
jgi:hypothetical protein